MGDALPRIIDVEQGDAGAPGRAPGAEHKLRAAGHGGGVSPSRQRIDDMIHDAEDMPDIAHRAVRLLHAVQSDAGGAFVQKNPIYAQQAGAVVQVGDQMVVPDFFKQGSGHGGGQRRVTMI